MKKSAVVFISFVLFCTLPFYFSCKKYEDGPYLSFHSAEERLTGKWKLNHILINNKDIITAYTASGLTSYCYYIYCDWYKNYFIGIFNTNEETIAKSKLQLLNHKTELHFGLQGQSPHEDIFQKSTDIIYPLSSEHNWKILRLKDDELNIKVVLQEYSCELRFKKISDFVDY